MNFFITKDKFLLAVFFCFTLHSTEYLCPTRAALKARPMTESPYFLVLCVDAPHFNYEDGLSFLQSWQKHPQGARKDGTVGHSWIMLKGTFRGKPVIIEGGQSGETGFNGKTYMERVAELIEAKDENPARALFEPLADGYFEKGPGTHFPTFAAKIDLTQEQFEALLRYIHPKNHPYERYSLTGNQCASYVAKVAELAGVKIESQVTMPLPSEFYAGGEHVVLYKDPKFSEITFSTPDKIEQELIRLVREGRAECALDWYYIMKAR